MMVIMITWVCTQVNIVRNATGGKIDECIRTCSSQTQCHIIIIIIIIIIILVLLPGHICPHSLFLDYPEPRVFFFSLNVLGIILVLVHRISDFSALLFKSTG